jgi:hypothetical protein
LKSPENLRKYWLSALAWQPWSRKMLLGALKVLRRADNAMRRAAKITVALPIIAVGLIGVSAPLSRATETTIEQMPAKLETQFALSALPPAMRDQALLNARNAPQPASAGYWTYVRLDRAWPLGRASIVCGYCPDLGDLAILYSFSLPLLASSVVRVPAIMVRDPAITVRVGRILVTDAYSF